jgi:hypothetical protein
VERDFTGFAASSVENNVDYFHVIREEIQKFPLVKSHPFLVVDITSYLSISINRINESLARLKGLCEPPHFGPRYPQMRINIS